MADIWLPGSTISLYRVPWDANYNNVVCFGATDDDEWQHQRDVYFEGLHTAEIVLSDSTYMPANQPIVIDIPYEQAFVFNYCIVTNTRFPTWPEDIEENTRYYFITDVKFNNPHTCTITVQLDVFQTFYPYCDIGTVYLEQGHLPFENAYAMGYKQNDDGTLMDAATIEQYYGSLEGNGSVPWNHRLFSWPEALRNYWNLAPGLDTGDEFNTIYSEVFSLDTETAQDGDNIIFITSTADLKSAAGTIDDPNLTTAAGGVADGVFSGCAVYAIESSYFADFMAFIASYSWVAQCIISIISVPLYMLGDSWERIKQGEPSIFVCCGISVSFPTYRVTGVSKANIKTISNVFDIKYIQEYGWSPRTEPYRDIPLLWAYPYSVVELTNFNGTSVFMKPQLMGYNVVNFEAMSETIPPFTRLGVYPAMYNAGGAQQADYPDDTNYMDTDIKYSYRNADGRADTTLKPGDYLDTCLWFTDFPQWSIVNNNYLTYMASTANTRAYNYSSAEWSYTSALASQRNTYANESASLATDQANYEASRQAQIDTNTINNTNSLINLGSSVAGDALSLNIGGLVSDAVTGVADYAAQLGKQSIDLALAAEQQANNQNLGYYQLNNNNELAWYVNTGDYANAIASIDAGIADAALTTPSQVGSMGGNGFRYANGLQNMLAVRYKRVNDDAIIRTGDYIRRYGMLVHRYVTMPAADKMQFNAYWTYYKCPEMAITSESYMDETTKDAIRGIFARGVTVWSRPEDIGRHVPVENKPDTTGDYIGVYY